MIQARRAYDTASEECYSAAERALDDMIEAEDAYFAAENAAQIRFSELPNGPAKEAAIENANDMLDEGAFLPGDMLAYWSMALATFEIL